MLEAGIIFAAGIWAGAINVVVGSGTLVTFPTLLLFGYPPLVANISNNIGMVAGGLSGIYGYRRELRGGGMAIFARLLPASFGGALIGAVLLLVLPDEVFTTIVPVLIAAGLLMVLAAPQLQRRAARRQTGKSPSGDSARIQTRIGLIAGVFAVSIYGGYFGAAQGILLVGLMGMLMNESLQRVNALKNVLATLVNSVAALTFMTVAWDRIDWAVVALIAVGSFIGGLVGAHVGRRLKPGVLRAVIVVVGALAIVKIAAFG